LGSVEKNIFLHIMIAHREFGPIAKKILDRIDSGEEAVTSSLTIAETCAWLEYRKRKADVDIFLDAVESHSSLHRCETTYADELRAKEIQPSYPRLEFFDRVYVAQMERLKLTEIYSNDRALDRVKGIKRIFE
jgi:predicted nucleic acid-binding protein